MKTIMKMWFSGATILLSLLIMIIILASCSKNSGPTPEPILNDSTVTFVSKSFPISIASQAIACDSAGNLWIAGSNVIVRMSPNGDTTQYNLPSKYPPSGIASDGTNMWVTDEFDGTVIKITPSGHITTYYIGGVPNAIASDGTNMWVTDEFNSTVIKITPSGDMTTYKLY